mmetsp:Transcript_52048/g.123933  ORF Transcript_52048/g.123933 Transcript_52048/m.123933 type:complete len:180 (-) Transcript_52048:143-682(-)|eukprot:CAMPEP_0178413032 /NCGR_PEP_ID=MMETSP0689_2-20121128/22321_1 /TAXON_ID=160604 /ORGANISM="Amphidinium massartii, Strain CS-259" /LENGTH=179 /DNA_ID=CAMNT_0020034297 /DNA_START=191 /DNA_END=730 /DNA_ORIENTATION=-
MRTSASLTVSAVLLLAHSLGAAEAVRMGTAAIARRHAEAAGQVLGESKAASHFTLEFVGSLPQNLTKAKQDAVVNVLEGEVAKLSENVDKIKDLQKTQSAHSKDQDKFLGSLKGKDHDMMESMNKWSARMNEKAKVGAMDVMSKLKNAIHLIKKGALAGDQKSADNLNKVLEQMAAMKR